MNGPPPKPPRTRPLGASLLPAVPVAAVGVLVIALTGFDGLYGQDAYAYYEYATGPLLDSMRGLDPPPPFFWPPGYPLLVAVGTWLLTPTPLVGQAVSLLAAATVPVLTVLLAREVWHRNPGAWPVALTAGVLMGVLGQLWQSGVVVMADTTGLAAAAAGAWAATRYARGSSPDSAEAHREGEEAPRAEKGSSHTGWLLLAAAAMAFAILTRWAYALVAVPVSAYALLALRRRPLPAALAHAGLAAAATLFVLAPLLPGVFGFLTGDGTDAFAGNLEVYSWNPARAFQREFETVDGRLSYTWPNGLYYALVPFHWAYFTPLLAPFVAWGGWRVIRSRRPGALLLCLAWPLVIYAFHAGAPWQNLRFGLAMAPPIAILAAIGGEGLALLGRPGRNAALALGVPAILLMAWGGWQHTEHLVSRKAADVETVRWVEERVPPSARLVVFELTSTFRHESDLEVHEIFVATPDSLAHWTAGDHSTYLLLDVPDVRTQWRELPPAENQAWLRENRGLQEVGEHRGFTLFRVGESR